MSGETGEAWDGGGSSFGTGLMIVACLVFGAGTVGMGYARTQTQELERRGGRAQR